MCFREEIYIPLFKTHSILLTFETAHKKKV